MDFIDYSINKSGNKGQPQSRLAKRGKNRELPLTKAESNHIIG